MKSKEEIINALNDNKALLQKLEEAWRDNASDEEITKIIVDAGTDLTMEDVQDILAICQKDTLEDLKNVPVDENQLESVAGGGTGICDAHDDCDGRFKFNCIRQPHKISKGERCHFWDYCDEFHTDPKWR